MRAYTASAHCGFLRFSWFRTVLRSGCCWIVPAAAFWMPFHLFHLPAMVLLWTCLPYFLCLCVFVFKRFFCYSTAAMFCCTFPVLRRFLLVPYCFRLNLLYPHRDPGLDFPGCTCCRCTSTAWIHVHIAVSCALLHCTCCCACRHCWIHRSGFCRLLLPHYWFLVLDYFLHPFLFLILLRSFSYCTMPLFTCCCLSGLL